MRLLKEEHGISLVEVVASIVLIMIILISFFGLLIQSNRLEKTSEKIVDATYLAQMEMENIYQISRNTDFRNLEENLLPFGYIKNTDDSINEYTKIQNPYTIHLSFSKRTTYPNLINIVVKVKEDGATKSKMENIYKWQVIP